MFEFLINIFNLTLYKPLFNLLVFLYNIIPGHDFGIAVIITTLVIKFILVPVSIKAVKSQRSLQKIQPKIQEIQKKYKDNKEKLAQEVLAVYKSEKINPFSGLLLALIQLPVLIALYRVFWSGLNPSELVNLYSFVQNPQQISALFFGLIDLSKGNIVLALGAGLVQYYQTKMLIPKNNPQIKGGDKTANISNIMQKQMVYLFPIITVIILMSLPSALGLYWVVSGIFSIIQQYFMIKKDEQNDIQPEIVKA